MPKYKKLRAVREAYLAGLLTAEQVRRYARDFARTGNGVISADQYAIVMFRRPAR